VTNSHQPSAAELSKLALRIAEGQKTSITPDNRKELLRCAYDLWQAAEKFIQERESLAKQEAATQDQQAWKEIAEAEGKRPSDDTVTFKEIVEKSLAPKRVGMKGLSGAALGIKGIEKSLKAFFKAKTSLPDFWHPSTHAKFGSPAYAKAFEKQAPSAKKKYLARILKEKKLPRPLFEKWLAWRDKKMRLSNGAQIKPQ